MSRAKVVRHGMLPYHVVARSHNKQWFPLNISEIWSIYLNLLKYIEDQCNVRIHVFVLMNNHFHLILTTLDENIDEAMYWFMKKSTHEVQKRAKVINSIYGGRYKASLLKEPSYIANAMKYVLLNPVRAKLCQLFEQYPYTLSKYAGSDLKLNINLCDPIYFKKAIGNIKCTEVIEWINQIFNAEGNKSIKVGLERPVFRYAKNDHTKKLIEPEIIHPRHRRIEECWAEFMPEKPTYLNSQLRLIQ